MTPKHVKKRPVPVTPPGITILENIKALGLTQADLAARMGRPLKTVNEIIRGKTALTPETALQLEHVLGIPASFWMAREIRYREYLARKKEYRTLCEAKEWLQQFPVGAMIEFGWLKDARKNLGDQVSILLDFLGIASPHLWGRILEPYVALRGSSTCRSDPGALVCWLRKGEIEAAKIECCPYSRETFKENLKAIRALTREMPASFVPKMRELCAQAGVAVVFVRELPGTRAYGAARWLGTDKALIQLSSRYKSDDQLWFSFFHEAGHLLYDGKKEAFLECDDGGEDEREKKANTFAANFLIPPQEYRSLLSIVQAGRRRISAVFVEAFAARLGIAPGIVVGRLQHDGVMPMNHLNKLKRYYDWPQDLIY